MCYLFPLLALVATHLAGGPLGVPHTWAVTRFPHFVFGVLLGRWIVGATRVWPHAGVAADALTMVVVGVVAAAAIAGRTSGVEYWWYIMLYAEFALVPVHALWIAALCHQEQGGQRCATARLLNCSILQAVGDISLAVYCLHYPILQLFTWLANRGVVPMQKRDRGMHMGIDTSTDGMFALDTYQLISVLCIVIVLATAANQLFEAPLRSRIAQKLCKQSRVREQAQAPADGTVVQEDREEPAGTLVHANA